MAADPASDILRQYSWSGRHADNDSPVNVIGSLTCLEAEAVVTCERMAKLVREIHISELLPRTPELLFINITTFEGNAYCVELTHRGWRVCSIHHDSMHGDLDSLDLHVQHFKTPYTLLERISSSYELESPHNSMSNLHISTTPVGIEKTERTHAQANGIGFNSTTHKEYQNVIKPCVIFAKPANPGSTVHDHGIEPAKRVTIEKEDGNGEEDTFSMDCLTE